ncbi:hypothetical protein NDU88_001611 [Pleurodeles waltl]|uniref:Uncharacterized protein n=1 Tax=Pleurodeles waltl TaxID=8319 RepID=A0AAV7TIB5_PLEWA|nr:hypothetical protein NDU88_001611 [Pleurodeles waltl]
MPPAPPNPDGLLPEGAPTLAAPWNPSTSRYIQETVFLTNLLQNVIEIKVQVTQKLMSNEALGKICHRCSRQKSGTFY